MKSLRVRVDKLCLGIIMCGLFISQLYSYAGGGYTLIRGSSYGYQQLGIADTITSIIKLMVLCALCIMFVLKTAKTSVVVGRRYIYIILILVGGVFYWLSVTLLDHGLLSLLHESTPPYVYLTALAFCVGADEELYEDFLGYARIIGFISLAMSLIEYIRFLIVYPGSLLGNSSVLTYYIQAFWLLYIVSMVDREYRTKQIFVMIAFVLLGILFNSRSWIIQSVIWAVVYSFYTDKRKGIIKLLKIAVILSAIMFVAYGLVSKYSPETLIYLLKKFGTDTRSGQYTALLSQIKPWDFVIGKGYDFSYYDASMGGNYSYIDNAYLFMLIRYGIWIGILYPMVFLIPAWRTFRNRRVENRNAVILFMWLLALGGLSVYCVTTVDIKSVALAVLAGRTLWEEHKARLIES